MSQQSVVSESNGSTEGRGNGVRSGRDRSERAERIQAMNIERAKDPRSVIILPKTNEGFMMCRMMIALDRAVYRLRREIGSSISFDKAAVALKKVEDLGAAMKDALKKFGIHDAGVFGAQNDLEAPEVRVAFAARRNAYVFLPRTQSLRDLIYGVRHLDSAMLSCRLTSTDLSASATSLKQAIEVVKQVNDLTAELSALVGIDYDPPRRYEQLEGGEPKEPRAPKAPKEPKASTVSAVAAS
ncbi:MAG: hypothetical protein AB1411_02630 [Nitrospirota bacterium]